MSDEGGVWTKSHELATQYAIEGLRALVLANGGAVVAVLSFSGNAGIDRVKPALVAASLMWFVGGLILALLTMLFAYLAQGAATHDKRLRTNLLEGIGTFLAVCSVAAFGVGAWTAQRGFITSPTPPTKVASAYTCDTAVAFIRAQADAGPSNAHNLDTGGEAVKVRGGWVVLPTCK